MKLTEKLLRKLFPKTINKIIIKAFQEAEEAENAFYEQSRTQEEIEENERQQSYWEECNKI